MELHRTLLHAIACSRQANRTHFPDSTQVQQIRLQSVIRFSFVQFDSGGISSEGHLQVGYGFYRSVFKFKSFWPMFSFMSSQTLLTPKGLGFSRYNPIGLQVKSVVENSSVSSL